MNHKSKQITILIPIYNIEEYLAQCLDSLCSQTLKDLDILCLNDGSTDRSPEILQDFAKKDQRIKIITKKNTGYGDTLNHGIKLARGEYIGIVEPDDFVEPNMFKDLLGLAKKHNADVVRCNYYDYKNKKDSLHINYTKEDANKIIDLEKTRKILYHGPAIWAGIYKKEYLINKKIFFLDTPGASYQDASFNFKTLAAGGRIVLSEKAYLHYRRDNMASSVKSNKKIYVVNVEYAEIESYLKTNKIWDEYKYVFQAVKFAGYHWNLLRLSGDDLKKFIYKMRKEFQNAKTKGLVKKAFFPKKHWLALKTLLLSPELFTLIFSTYQKNKKAGL